MLRRIKLDRNQAPKGPSMGLRRVRSTALPGAVFLAMAASTLEMSAQAPVAKPSPPVTAAVEATAGANPAAGPAGVERQHEISDDSAMLLKLATDLKAEVDKTSKDTLSISVIRKADEIERLAHAVRDRMKVSTNGTN